MNAVMKQATARSNTAVKLVKARKGRSATTYRTRPPEYTFSRNFCSGSSSRAIGVNRASKSLTGYPIRAKERSSSNSEPTDHLGWPVEWRFRRHSLIHLYHPADIAIPVHPLSLPTLPGCAAKAFLDSIRYFIGVLRTDHFDVPLRGNGAHSTVIGHHHRKPNIERFHDGPAEAFEAGKGHENRGPRAPAKELGYVDAAPP